jgi:3-hydroxyacyl-[acyl-carrier-protein] dehydratase
MSSEGPAVAAVIEHKDLKKYLRHGYPFLLVDRILEIDGERAVGIKNISGTDQFVQGHFPEAPIFPGVLLIETLAQVGAVLLAHRHPEYQSAASGYLTKVHDFKFKRLVVPGDQLVIEAVAVARSGPYARVRVTGRVDGQEAASGEITYYIA